jgi:sigma-E factor negative regulatory protein RseA
MSQPDPNLDQSRQILSALADGEASDIEGADAFHAWREHEEVRATWHTYHLIGDVMRSDDLASPVAGQQRLLAALRERLAAEPVVLAPQPAAAEVRVPAEPARVGAPAVANGRMGGWIRAHWQAPVAVAAGFLAVVGMQFARGPSGSGRPADYAALAGASAPAALVAAARTSAPLPLAQAPAVTATQARAQAEQIAPYLAAHRQSTMNAAFQMPSGDIRNVSLAQPAQ